MIPAPLHDLQNLLERHQDYRARTLNLIASENAMSPTVEALLRPELSHRYGDYTGADIRTRRYTGNRYLTDLDVGAQEAVKALFGCQFADLRPLSGHVAGAAAIMALCAPNDTVLELNSEGGGHRLAGKLSQARLCPLRVLPLPLDADSYNISLPTAIEQIERERPKLVILGSSLFLFPHPVAELAEATHRVGGHLLFDASHVLGLIAGGAYPNPLDAGADLITSSTHKTFAGPQGGLLLTNDAELYARIVPAIYPALVTNHHLHRLPALWAVCAEWREFGRDHAAAIVANARALGAALDAVGLSAVGKQHGYTATHTILVAHPNAKQAAARLEAANILVTPVGLPPALGGASQRIGIQEITRRGMVPEDAPRIAQLIAATLKSAAGPAELETEIASAVAQCVAAWQQWRFTWQANRGEEWIPCAS